MQRTKWNDGWRVWREKSTFNLVFAVPGDALTVDLPWDAAFHTAQDPACPSAGSTGFIGGGVFNYCKELELSPGDMGQTFLLEIEGAMSRSFVYVNGSMAGSCSYGYTDYTVDMTPYLREGANRILVVCAADDRSSRYYAGCGLYRDVWLLRGGDAYVEPDSLWVRTLRTGDGYAAAEVSVSIRNAAAAPKDARVRFTMKGPDGNAVLDASYPVLLRGGSATALRKVFTVDDPALWSEDEPNLYTCSAVLWRTGEGRSTGRASARAFAPSAWTRSAACS